MHSSSTIGVTMDVTAIALMVMIRYCAIADHW